MNIRQPYTDPETGRNAVQDVEIYLEDVRSGNGFSSEPRIIAWMNERHVSCCPHEQIIAILDGKRTFVPKNVQLTRLARKADGNIIHIENDIGIRPGDPLAIMRNANGDYIRYFLARGAQDKTIALGDHATFPAGSLVHCLANRWWTSPLGDETGMNARLCRPEPIAYHAKIVNNSITIVVTPPLHSPTIHVFDVYVRNHDFNKLESHWIADLADCDNFDDPVTINSYNGGAEAYGDVLKVGKYWLTVVAKDRSGWCNANESECRLVEELEIQN